MKGLGIDLVMLLPAVIPLAGVVAVLVADLVSPRLRGVPYAIAAVAALAAAGATIPGLAQGAGTVQATFCVLAPATAPSTAALPEIGGLPQTCFWQASALASALQLAACLAAAVCLALAWPGTRRRASGVSREPVEAILFLAALSGTVVVAASTDIGTWLVALELATLPVVALVALTGTRAAVAGSIQLLVTSLVSFALLAVGAALWFLASGSPFFNAGAALAADPRSTVPMDGSVALPPSIGLLSLSVVLILAGVAFKLSLVPFHAWTPTAYAGSTPAVATFLATVSKIGALAALVVVLQAVRSLGAPGLVAVAILSAASMTLGNLMALRQVDVVRLLAWSTVAQAGWVVLPLVSVSALGQRSAAIYLLTYVAATLVAFAVVSRMIREVGARGRDIAAYADLWHRSPWRAGALALALTSLAGLPPGVVGLVGKIVAFRPVVAEGWVWLTIIAAANAVLGVAVYLRWLRPVVSAPEAEAAAARPDAAPVVARRGNLVAITVGLAVSSVVLVVISVQPQFLLGLFGS